MRLYSYTALRLNLEEYDSRFEFYESKRNRNIQIIYHPEIHGYGASYPIHLSVDNHFDTDHLMGIVRRFDLPESHFDISTLTAVAHMKSK